MVPALDPESTRSRFAAARVARLATLRRDGTPRLVPITFVLLDVAGGLRVVATPGHTPGHVSLLHEPTRTLITGDAVVNVLGVHYPPRFFCSDFRMTKRTAHVLGELEYERVGFTHGPDIVDGAREAVRRFLRHTVTPHTPE